jgi:hypothetical protein
MSHHFSREDIRSVGDNMYQIGSVEFEIVQGSNLVGYKNVETEESGSTTIEEIDKQFGSDVADFLKDKLQG